MLYEKIMDCEKDAVYQITDWIRESIKDSGVENGIAVLFAPHTTSGVSLTPYMLDDYDLQDVQKELDKIIPMRVDYTHQFDTPADAAGHNKSGLMGVSKTFIVDGGKLQLGSSQGVFFYEFDGPRVQKCWLKVFSD